MYHPTIREKCSNSGENDLLVPATCQGVNLFPLNSIQIKAAFIIGEQGIRDDGCEDVSERRSKK